MERCGRISKRPARPDKKQMTRGDPPIYDGTMRILLMAITLIAACLDSDTTLPVPPSDCCVTGSETCSFTYRDECYVYECSTDAVLTCPVSDRE